MAQSLGSVYYLHTSCVRSVSSWRCLRSKKASDTVPNMNLNPAPSFRGAFSTSMMLDCIPISSKLAQTNLHPIPDAGSVLALGGVIWYFVKRQPVSLWHGLALGLAQLLLSAQSLKAWKKGASSTPYILGSLSKSAVATRLANGFCSARSLACQSNLYLQSHRLGLKKFVKFVGCRPNAVSSFQEYPQALLAVGAAMFFRVSFLGFEQTHYVYLYPCRSDPP